MDDAFTPLELDADRAFKEIWAVMQPNSELEVVVVVREKLLDFDDTEILNVNGCMKADLSALYVLIQVSSVKVTTGPALWSVLAHEVAHIYQAELHEWMQDSAHLRGMTTILAGRRALEMANLRVERLFLRAYPCPEWLAGRTYTPGGES